MFQIKQKWDPKLRSPCDDVLFEEILNSSLHLKSNTCFLMEEADRGGAWASLPTYQATLASWGFQSQPWFLIWLGKIRVKRVLNQLIRWWRLTHFNILCIRWLSRTHFPTNLRSPRISKGSVLPCNNIWQGIFQSH